MSEQFSLVCQGAVSVLPDGAPTCSGIWALVQVPATFSFEQLDPAMVTASFMAGFVIVGTCWFAGKCFSTLLSLIR
jgi:hypothetical protein